MKEITSIEALEQAKSGRKWAEILDAPIKVVDLRFTILSIDPVNALVRCGKCGRTQWQTVANVRRKIRHKVPCCSGCRQWPEKQERLDTAVVIPLQKSIKRPLHRANLAYRPGG